MMRSISCTSLADVKRGFATAYGHSSTAHSNDAEGIDLLIQFAHEVHNGNLDLAQKSLNAIDKGLLSWVKDVYSEERDSSGAMNAMKYVLRCLMRSIYHFKRLKRRIKGEANSKVITEVFLNASRTIFHTFQYSLPLFPLVFYLQSLKMDGANSVFFQSLNTTKSISVKDSEGVEALDELVYDYYICLSKIFNGEYSESLLEMLTTILTQTPFKYEKKRSKIAKWILLVVLSQCRAPSQWLLNSFPENTKRMGELIRAVRLGHLETYQEYFRCFYKAHAKDFSIMLVSHLELVVLRNLLRKTVKACGGTNQLPVRVFREALNFSSGRKGKEDEYSDEQVEFIVANLHFKKMIKANVSHDQKIIVLAPQPFPKPPIN
jgi:PCI domain